MRSVRRAHAAADEGGSLYSGTFQNGPASTNSSQQTSTNAPAPPAPVCTAGEYNTGAFDVFGTVGIHFQTIEPSPSATVQRVRERVLADC